MCCDFRNSVSLFEISSGFIHKKCYKIAQKLQNVCTIQQIVLSLQTKTGAKVHLFSNIHKKITKKIKIFMKKDDFRFRDFLKHVAKSFYKEIRRQIIAMCKISKSCFYKWIEGTSTPNEKRRTIINGIAVKFGYSPVYPNNKTVKMNPSIFVTYASK